MAKAGVAHHRRRTLMHSLAYANKRGERAVMRKGGAPIRPRSTEHPAIGRRATTLICVPRARGRMAGCCPAAPSSFIRFYTNITQRNALLNL